jgi:glucosylceramidase
MVNTASGGVTRTIEYYTLGHFSKYVLPGATRVYSSNATGIVSAAFVNPAPDNSRVLVVFNDTTGNNTFRAQWGAQSFAYTLPALSGATFTWSGTQSGGYTVTAVSPIQASSFNGSSGLQTETTSDSNGGYAMGFADNGDYAVYRNVDFGPGTSGIRARLACDQNNAGNCGGTLEFRLGSPSGQLVSSVIIPSTGGWQAWTTVSGSASGAAGVHDLYFIFKQGAAGGATSLGNLNWFQFN